jgi:hypothetical protein
LTPLLYDLSQHFIQSSASKSYRKPATTRMLPLETFHNASRPRLPWFSRFRLLMA